MRVFPIFRTYKLLRVNLIKEEAPKEDREALEHFMEIVAYAYHYKDGLSSRAYNTFSYRRAKSENVLPLTQDLATYNTFPSASPSLLQRRTGMRLAVSHLPGNNNASNAYL